MKNKTIAAILVVLLVSGGCQYKKELASTTDCSGTVSFADEVSGIIEKNCAVASCHNASSTNIGGPFTNYSLIKNKAATIKQQVVAGFMPQGSTLSAADIKTISCWVDAGAPDN